MHLPQTVNTMPQDSAASAASPIGKSTIGLLSALGLAVAWLLAGTQGDRTSRVLPIVLAGLGVLFLVPEQFRPRTSAAEFSKRIGWAICLFTVYFLLRDYWEGVSLAIHQVSKPVRVEFVQNVVLLAGLFCVVLRPTSRTWQERLELFIVAMGVGAGLRHLIEIVQPGLGGEFGESRFEWADNRWIPPFVRSNGTFAMIASVCGTLGMLLVVEKGRGIAPMRRVILGAATLALFAASVRCQFRAHLLTVAGGVAWWVLPRVFKPAVTLGATLVFLLFPLLFISSQQVALIETLRADVVLERLGSRTEGAQSLSGRTDLYAYGWDRVFGGEVGLFGEGPRLRDASPALPLDQQMITLRVGFHSGFLDAVVCHGVLLGGAWLGVIVVTIASLVRAYYAGGSEGKPRADMLLAWVTLWMIIGIMDGGFSASFENHAIAFVPVGVCLIVGQGAEKDDVQVRSSRT